MATTLIITLLEQTDDGDVVPVNLGIASSPDEAVELAKDGFRRWTNFELSPRSLEDVATLSLAICRNRDHEVSYKIPGTRIWIEGR
ncbi:MAG TPA: hypothetical protein VMS04_11100 [Vicinamibacterales bacterium]|jgi:hypothetical protein|nr:hypothetical protein [Vicinamibacterales bacterium]